MMNEAYRWRAEIAFGAAPRSDLANWRARYGAAIKAVAMPAADLMIAPGAAIKAIGDSGWTEGYLLRFGTDQDDGDLSQHRDVFQPPPNGYYGRQKRIDMHVHHGMLPEFGKKELTNQAEIEIDKIGMFVKHLLDLRDPYERALFALTKQGKLGYSSGSNPHLVERKAIAGGRHLITRWPVTEASYTPTPAGGPGVRAIAAMKSMLLDAGVDLARAPQRSEMQMTPGSGSGDLVDHSDRWGLKDLDIIWYGRSKE
jgi:hypothetical protein